MEALSLIQVVFPQLKLLCSSRIELTLDADNVPAGEYTKVQLTSQYLLAYNEYYLSNPPASQAKSTDLNSHEDEIGDEDGFEDGDILEGNNTKPMEFIFRINGDSMQQEYQLTTLVVGKKKTVNLKQVVERKSQEIRETDVMEFEPEGSIFHNRENPEEYLKKRGRPATGSLIDSNPAMDLVHTLMKVAASQRGPQQSQSTNKDGQGQEQQSVDPVVLTLLGIPPDSVQQLPGFGEH